MFETYLTVKDVAELKGCTQRAVRLLIESNSLQAKTVEVQGIGPGRGGIQYRIPLSALDKKLQLKYKRRHRETTQASLSPIVTTPVPVEYEHLTEHERREIAFWKSILDEWDSFRNNAVHNGGSKGEADMEFINTTNEKWKHNPPPFSIKLSLSQLHRRRKDLYEKGEASLIDRRGKHGKHSRKLTDEMLDIFEYYYLDDSQKTASLCTFLVERELKRRYGAEVMPEMPSKDTFERAAQRIPIPIAMYFRERKIDFIGECAPYIERMYDMEPNDIWVADNHTFDIMVNKGGKPVRLFLTAFMDVKSRKIMGWCITDNPGSDATIYALKKGIAKYGAPKTIYCDNGREFLFHDFGGNGFRKTAKLKEREFKPPSILKDLGITFMTALPANARAKGIERAFKNIKENFSKLFDSYTGGHVLEKPDSLKEVLKRPGLLPSVEEFHQYVDAYITGYHNKQPHSGDGMYGRFPDEVFAAELIEKRVVPPDMLNLMFMRYSKGTIKVGKNGIALTLYGQKLHYFDEELWRIYFGKEVYVRYSPDDLSSVRVYDTEQRFICEAPLKEKLGYNATKEELQAAQRENRQAVKSIASYKKAKGTQAQHELDAMLEAYAEGQEMPENLNPKVLRIIQGEKTIHASPKAAGAEHDEPLDWMAGVQKLKERKAM